MISPRRPAVLVIGDVFTDIVVRPEGPLVPGADRRSAIRMLPGGSGANQAAWLAAEGVRTVLVGRVGRSDHTVQKRLLAEAGVEAALACDDALPTGIIVSMIAPDGERSFFTDRGANDRLCRADLPVSLLDDIDLVHVSGYALVTSGPRAAVRDLIGEAGACGIPWTVDPPSTSFLAEIGVASFLAWTRSARICFPNAAEAALLAGTTDPAMQVEALCRQYDTIVIKRGAAGAAAGDSSGRCWLAPAASVEAVDTTGAGDAFLAGFLAANLRGQAMQACLEAGVEAGSRAVTMVGARPQPAKPGAAAPAKPLP